MIEFNNLIISVGPFLLSLLIALAINIDCRARNLAQRRLYTVLAFFFPVIVGIVYAVKRKSMQKAFKICSKCGSKAEPYAPKCPKCGGYMLLEYKNPKEKMLKIISIVLCVAGIASYSCFVVVEGKDIVRLAKSEYNAYINGDYEEAEEEEYFDYENLPELCYDRNGIAYSDFYSIKYYDKEGNEYHWNETLDGLIDGNGKSYASKHCYVDSDGYFCYLENDDSGDYYSISSVYWNYDGSIMNIE